MNAPLEEGEVFFANGPYTVKHDDGLAVFYDKDGIFSGFMAWSLWEQLLEEAAGKEQSGT